MCVKTPLVCACRGFTETFAFLLCFSLSLASASLVAFLSHHHEYILSSHRLPFRSQALRVDAHVRWTQLRGVARGCLGEIKEATFPSDAPCAIVQQLLHSCDPLRTEAERPLAVSLLRLALAAAASLSPCDQQDARVAPFPRPKAPTLERNLTREEPKSLSLSLVFFRCRVSEM